MNERDFLDPAFDVDKWINSTLSEGGSGTIEQYEEQCNQIITKLQLRSRDISQSADQNVRSILQSLPKAMAKLKYISSNVDELSESLRSLTNSGYHFKSGNVPDRINELGSLKERRDRLKDATELLNSGIRIEKDIQQLTASANTGDLQIICQKLMNVSSSADILSTVSKFRSITNELSQIQRITEGRIKNSLIQSCNSMNAAEFTKYSTLAKQIQADSLPITVVQNYYKDKVTKILNDFNDGSLMFLDWMKPCLDQCCDSLVRIYDWCMAMKPAQFEQSLLNELYSIMSNILSSPFMNEAKNFLGSSSFDNLVVVSRFLRSYPSTFPPTMTISNPPVEKCLQVINFSFPEKLQQYFHSILPPKVLPKSNTTGTLSKTTTPSSSRSSENLANSTFDQNILERQFGIASKSLEWIDMLSNDNAKCIKHVIQFLTLAISNASSDLENFVKGKCQKDTNEPSQLDELLQVMIFEEKMENQIFNIEKSMAQMTNAPNNTASQAFITMKSNFSNQITNYMSQSSIIALNDVHNQNKWVSNEDLSLLEPSTYAKNVSNNILGLLRQLTSIQNLNEASIPLWMSKTVNTILKCYSNEIIKIPKFSIFGQNQLKTDILYLKQMLTILDVGIGKDLDDILQILSEENPINRSKLFIELSTNQTIVQALKRSLPTQ